MDRDVRTRFLEEGYVVVPGLLDAHEAAGYVAQLKVLAGGKARWTQADGMHRHPEFWPIIFNARLLAVVRDILGPEARYLPQNDLHLGFSSFAWHRDSVNRKAGVGPDWVTAEPYRLIRAGLYLQPGGGGFHFGVVPGSHRPDTGRTGWSAWQLRLGASAAANVVSGLSGADLLGPLARWTETGAGDGVLFDPRLLHTGSRFHGEKHSIFVGYGLENAHFRRHWHYYVTLRTDLGYSPMPPELADRLRAADLLAAAPPADLPVEHAWLPSAAFAAVARLFK